MNGMMGGGMMGNTMMQSSAGTSGLSTEMAAFMGSIMNKSGLTATNVQSLMNKLSSSNGTIQ